LVSECHTAQVYTEILRHSLTVNSLLIHRHLALARNVTALRKNGNRLKIIRPKIAGVKIARLNQSAELAMKGARCVFLVLLHNGLVAECERFFG
jgi:hypothetical protein